MFLLHSKMLMKNRNVGGSCLGLLLNVTSVSRTKSLEASNPYHRKFTSTLRFYWGLNDAWFTFCLISPCYARSLVIMCFFSQEHSFGGMAISQQHFQKKKMICSVFYWIKHSLNKQISKISWLILKRPPWCSTISLVTVSLSSFADSFFFI